METTRKTATWAEQLLVKGVCRERSIVRTSNARKKKEGSSTSSYRRGHGLSRWKNVFAMDEEAEGRGVHTQAKKNKTQKKLMTIVG